MQGSSLKEIKSTISLSQKMMGALLADSWSRSENPPVGADKSHYYAAALRGSISGESRSRIARCLVWSDFAANQYCPSYADLYTESLHAYPNDERTIFFVAALCELNVIQQPEVRALAYQRLLQPEWDRSPYWNRFVLPQKKILIEAANLYASELDVITPDRIEVVERALERAEDRVAVKAPYARYLATAFRNEGRTDETAELLYRYVFNHVPEDTENNGFLARLYRKREKKDGDACAVFARMAMHEDEQDNLPEANYWVLQLAQTYLALGRVDEGTLPAYQRAAAITPEDQDLRAALLCAVARRRERVPSRETVTLLEEALEEERVLEPRFTERRWDWSLIVRALAHAYGTMSRTDDEAMEIFKRATDLCPEERELWTYYAKGLALRGDFSPDAQVIYERAMRYSSGDEAITVALARAYVKNKAQDGESRRAAMRLWEGLYRQGIHWSDMVQALATAYAAEDTVNDIALSLWEKSIEDDKKNGVIRLRIAQEYRSRSEYERAGFYYREAAKLLPKDFTAQFEAACLLADHFNDYTTAIRLLQKAVKLPEGEAHLQAHFRLGEMLLGKEKRDQARVVFQKIVDDLDPNHTPSLLHLAKLSLKYEEEGVRQAETLYQQAREASPNEAETYRRMAELYHEKGQFAEEEQALEKYLELAEPDGDNYVKLADLYIRRQEFGRAETALRRAISLGKNEKRLYSLLGEVLAQGQRQNAQKAADREEDVAA
ncbi:MAG: hypothetical protein OHK0029_38260 [Armatimonadaceae bacterium]